VVDEGMDGWNIKQRLLMFEADLLYAYFHALVLYVKVVNGVWGLITGPKGKKTVDPASVEKTVHMEMSNSFQDLTNKQDSKEVS